MSCSPALTRRARSAIAVGWSPAGWKSETTWKGARRRWSSVVGRMSPTVCRAADTRSAHSRRDARSTRGPRGRSTRTEPGAGPSARTETPVDPRGRVARGPRTPSQDHVTAEPVSPAAAGSERRGIGVPEYPAPPALLRRSVRGRRDQPGHPRTGHGIHGRGATRWTRRPRRGPLPPSGRRSALCSPSTPRSASSGAGPPAAMDADSWVAWAWAPTSGSGAGSTTRSSRSRGHEVRTRPVGSVQTARASGSSRTRQPGRCLTRWWRRQRHMRLAASVGPAGHGRTWSRSQNRAATEHPGKRQRPSRILTRALSRPPGR